MKKFSVLAAGLLLAASAQAALIEGSLSFSGFLDDTPGAGSTSVVAGLTSIDVNPAALAGSPTGVFAAGPATAYDFSIAFTPFTVFETGGFTFNVLAVDSVLGETPLDCTAAGTGFLCDDTLVIDFTGLVSGAGYETAVFNGSFSAQGVCASNDGLTCAGPSSASYSASIVATGEPGNLVPEPGTLLLGGLGLAGAALVSRRKA